MISNFLTTLALTATPSCSASDCSEPFSWSLREKIWVGLLFSPFSAYWSMMAESGDNHFRLSHSFGPLTLLGGRHRD